jgi:hypothetical protein
MENKTSDQGRQHGLQAQEDKIVHPVKHFAAK